VGSGSERRLTKRRNQNNRAALARPIQGNKAAAKMIEPIDAA
jgi:hypothetical protein